MLGEEQKGRYGGQVTIDGAKYSAGLFWQLADDPDGVMQEAKSVAQTEGVDSDFFCVLSGDTAQYGLGWVEAGHEAGTYSLAVTLMDTLGGSFIGVFQIEDQWWFGSAHNNMILPEGDALYNDEMQARQHFEREYAHAPDDITIFVPESWGIANARSDSIRILIDQPSSVRLRWAESFFVRRKGLIIVGALVSFALFFFGPKIIEMFKPGAMINVSSTVTPTPQKPMEPWQDKPVAGQVISACHRGFSKISVIIPNWQISTIKCERDRVESFLKRGKKGYIASLQSVGKRLNIPVQFSPTGKDAVLNLPLEKLPPRKADRQRKIVKSTDLWQGQFIRESLWELGNKVGVEFEIRGTLNPPPPPPPRRGPNGELIPVPPPPSSLQFSLESNIPIQSWVSVFDSIPGFVVNAIKWDFVNGTWIIKGEIYRNVSKKS